MKAAIIHNSSNKLGVTEKFIKVAIIILNWNYYQLTISCLKSLQKIRTKNIKVIIYLLDNGSTNNSAAKLSKFIKNCPLDIQLFQSKENLGFAKGNNFLIKRALIKGPDYLCLLNNDTVVEKNFLSRLVSMAKKDCQIGAVGGKIYFLNKERTKKPIIWYAGGTLSPQEIYPENRGYKEIDHGQYDQTEETDFITGCLFLIKTEILGKTGLFDERFFHSYEDVDFSLKIKKNGFNLIYYPKAVIWHYGSVSSGLDSEFMKYFTTKGAWLYTWKWLPLTTKLRLFIEGARTLVKGSPWEKRAVLDFFRLRFGRGSWKET